MFTLLCRLTSTFFSRQTTSWSVSLTTHLGLFCALSIAVSAARAPRPSLHGDRIASLQSIASAPQPDWRAADLELGEIQVVIEPQRAHVADQIYERVTEPLDLPRVELAVEQAALDQPQPEPPPDAVPSDEQPAPPAPQPEEQEHPKSSTPAPASLASRGSIGLDDDTPPRPIANQPPIYPEPARAAGWQGTVVLRLIVDAAGAVALLEVDRSSGHEILDAAAVRAVRTWRFEPARSPSGAAVTWEGKLPVRFTLSGR